MKKLIGILVVVVGLTGGDVAQARGGHGGHGHAGRGGHHGARHVGHLGFHHRGFYRRAWRTRTWNARYGRYFYSDPAVVGTYYLSDTDNLYYPIADLPVIETVKPVLNVPAPVVDVAGTPAAK